jgi:hypothetical protein
MNQIYAASQVGILIDAARPQGQLNPTIGGVRNLPTLNSDRLVPGVTVSNNVVSNSGLTGIQYNGDPNTPVTTPTGTVTAPISAVPFGRIVNNTVYGATVPSGTGIAVTNNAGPTLLNNIVANTNVGIAVDASSRNTTVLGANLYSNNIANLPAGGSTGSNPIVLAPNAPLFINADAQNFYLAPNSLAIDSSLNSLGDRASITTVKSSIGIPASPILSPDRDIYGQLRVDDPSQNPPPGLGQNVFKDRGAVERADFTNPTVSILDPEDNDLNTPFHDRNRTVNDIAIRNENLTQFVVKLSDDGAGIDDFTVDHTKFTITMDGVVLNDQVTAAALGVNPDYEFVYNAATDEAIFSPSAGIWPLNHTYRIIVNNNAVGATDSTGSPLPAGIFDLAGNPLAANRDTGEASFSIFVGTLYDFGDAPSNLVNQHYPVTLVEGGAAHVVQDGYYLGTGISEESDAIQNATATADVDDPVTPQYSDGITLLGNPSPTKTTTIVNTMTVVAHLPAGMTVSKLDVWYDLNRDGDWTDPGEKLILTNTSHPGSDPNDIFDGSNTFTYTFGDATAAKGPTFARFRLSPTGVSSPNFVVVNGVVPDGEVEDKQIFIGGAPFQNPKTGFARNELDVNDDGVISASDVLTIINWINATSATFPTGKLTLGAPPIPNPSLGPGKSLYVDVDGDTFMSATDVQIVISYINSQESFSGEGEGGSASDLAAAGIDASFDSSNELSSASSSASNVAAGDLIIPPVLVASPDVVLEVRDRSPVATLAVNQSAANDNPQDQALLAMNDMDSLNESLTLASNTKKTAAAAFDCADEESWEDLLTSLAEDHETKI